MAGYRLWVWDFKKDKTTPGVTGMIESKEARIEKKPEQRVSPRYFHLYEK
jgi:hypothetical protein